MSFLIFFSDPCQLTLLQPSCQSCSDIPLHGTKDDANITWMYHTSLHYYFCNTLHTHLAWSSVQLTPPSTPPVEPSCPLPGTAFDFLIFLIQSPLHRLRSRSGRSLVSKGNIAYVQLFGFWLSHLPAPRLREHTLLN
jgi:hypothetical protein